MESNLFYSRGRNKGRKTPKKLCFKERKENTIASLNEVEHFLSNYNNFITYIRLYKLFR